MTTSVAIDPSASVRQQIQDLWAQGRRPDAVNELEKAVVRWPQDALLMTARERFAEDAKATSEQARRQAEGAGAAEDPLFVAARGAAERAQTHASNGRHVDSIRAYLEATHNYTRALENAGPVAAIDAYLKLGDRRAALDLLTRGLTETPGNALLNQRLDRLRTDAVKAADTAHQALTRQKSFDQGAADYQAARQQYDAAKGRSEPASIRVLLELPARFTAAGGKMSEAAALHARGLDQSRAGQRHEALATLRDARTRFPGYRATRQLGQELRASASDQAQRTKKAAAAAGPNAQASAAFAEALKAEQQASQASADEAAVEAWHKAMDFFAIAEKEGRKATPVAPTAPPAGGNSAGGGGAAGAGRTGATSPAGEKPTPTPTPTPPAVPTATGTANPVRPDRGAEELAIKATIDQYTRGYREMNAAVIRNVYPTFSRERQSAIERAARDCKAYVVELDAMKTDFVEGAERATVTATARYGCDPKRGGGIDYSRAETEIFILQKENGRWIISAMPGR
jgi:hypothetical protein